MASRTAFTTRGHVVRAMLEAICFQTREVLEAMILDTAGMQHSASCPDLDPVALEVDTAAAAAAAAGGQALAPAGPVAPPLAAAAAVGAAGAGAAAAGAGAARAGTCSGGGGGGGGGGGFACGSSAGGGVRASSSSCGSSAQLATQGYRLNLLRVDGGATNNNLLMQLQVCVLVCVCVVCFVSGGQQLSKCLCLSPHVPSTSPPCAAPARRWVCVCLPAPPRNTHTRTRTRMRAHAV
jgi:hypothetical protein